MKNKTLIIAGQEIAPGTRTQIVLSSPTLYTQTNVDLPVHVFHGYHAGPKLFVIGTIHGDELDSIEIIRRLHKHSILKRIHGTLITIPVANIYGFITRSRYLPDRRDLNRSFPGSKGGSLAARLANSIIEEVVMQCNYGIDLHTGAFGRMNMPQVRVNLDTPGADQLARAFDVPVILNAKVRDGSLRFAASELGIPLLVYEGGEALRFDEFCIRLGVLGILNVMHSLGMITRRTNKKPRKSQAVITDTSRWVRSTASGVVQSLVQVANTVKKDDVLATVHDPFLTKPSVQVLAPFDGIVIGKANLPLVNEGDALFNIASITKLENVEAYIEELSDEVTEQGPY